MPPSIVLGENLLDAEAYIFGAKHAKAKKKLKDNCKMKPAPGGGSEISVALGAIIQHESGFCFCITDGDYCDPKTEQSLSTKRCLELANKTLWPTLALDIKAKSIENILPINILEDALIPFPSTAFYEFKRFATADRDIATYLNIKDGLKYCSISSEANESSRKTFWISKFNSLGFSDAIKKFAGSVTTCNDDKCNECPSIQGIGPKVLARVVDYFKKTTPYKIAERTDDESLWIDLGIEVYRWCLADDPIRL